jgi:hypothetical protein
LFARIPLETRTLLAILVGALVLRLYALLAFATDYDEGVYWQSLRTLAQGHPLYSAIYSSQPPVFLLGIYPLYALFGQTLPAARFAVVLYSLAGIAALYAIGKALGGPWTGLAAAALLAVDPLYLRASRTLQAEVPALAFALVGLAVTLMALRQIGRRRQIWLVAGGALVGFAILTKLYVAVALLPAALFVVMAQVAPAGGRPTQAARTAAGKAGRPPARQTRPRKSARAWPDMVRLRREIRAAAPDVGALLAGTLGAVLVVLLPFVGSLPALFDQTVALHLAAARALDRGLAYNLHLLSTTLTSEGEYWLLAVALAGVALAVWRRAWDVVAVAAWALVSLLMLIAIQPLFAHHLVLLVPPLALLAGLALHLAPRLARARTWRRPITREAMLRALRQPTVLTYGALILLGVTFVAGLWFGLADSQHAAEYAPTDQLAMANALSNVTPSGQMAVTDDQYLAGLVGIDVPPELVDTSEVRIAGGQLTASELERAITQSGAPVVLFASGRFDEVPGFRAWAEANFKQVQSFGAGRALYLKQSGPVIA